MSSKWTADMDTQLIDLRSSGCSFTDAAEKLGVSRNAVLGRYQRLVARDPKLLLVAPRAGSPIKRAQPAPKPVPAAKSAMPARITRDSMPVGAAVATDAIWRGLERWRHSA